MAASKSRERIAKERLSEKVLRVKDVQTRLHNQLDDIKRFDNIINRFTNDSTQSISKILDDLINKLEERKTSFLAKLNEISNVANVTVRDKKEICTNVLNHCSKSLEYTEMLLASNESILPQYSAASQQLEDSTLNSLILLEEDSQVVQDYISLVPQNKFSIESCLIQGLHREMNNFDEVLNDIKIHLDMNGTTAEHLYLETADCMSTISLVDGQQLHSLINSPTSECDNQRIIPSMYTDTVPSWSLPVQSIVYILILRITSLTSLITQPYSDNLVELSSALSDYCQQVEYVPNEFLLNLKVNQICCGKFTHDGSWYRAQIQEFDHNHTNGSINSVCVRYIDYGNIEILPASYLLPLPVELGQLPAQALYLNINNIIFPLPPLPADMISSLEKWMEYMLVGTISQAVITNMDVNNELDVNLFVPVNVLRSSESAAVLHQVGLHLPAWLMECSTDIIEFGSVLSSLMSDALSVVKNYHTLFGDQPITEPIIESSQPITESVAEPIIKSSQPITELSQPITESVAEPIIESSQLITELSQPITESVAEPIIESSQPITELSQPITESVAEPIIESSQPITESSQPITESVAEPIIESSQPITESSQPIIESSQPITESSQPITESCQPITELSQPITESVAEPIIESSQPITESSQPITESSQPITESSQPTIESSQPIIESSQPITESVAEPIIESSQPITESSQPITESCQPITESSQPITESVAEPIIESSQPITESSQPTIESSQLIIESSQPITESSQPIIESSQPITESSQPIIESSQPITESSQPITESSQPITESFLPHGISSIVTNTTDEDDDQLSYDDTLSDDGTNIIAPPPDFCSDPNNNDTTINPSPSHKEPADIITIPLSHSLSVGDQLTLIVSHVQDPSCFYVFPADKSQSLNVLEIELANHYCQLSNRRSVTMPMVGGVCCIESSRANKGGNPLKCRGIILCVKEGVVSVLLVDYGLIEDDVMASQLYELEKWFIETPSQCICCSLYGITPSINESIDDTSSVPPLKWSDDAVKFFNSSVENDLFLGIIRDREEVSGYYGYKYSLTIHDTINNCMMNTVLVDTGYAIYTRRESSSTDSLEGLDEWDPMSGDYLATRNTYHIDEEDVHTAIHGYKGSDIKICRYYNTIEGCFAGSKCHFKHLPSDVYDEREEETYSTVALAPILPAVGDNVLLVVTGIKSILSFMVHSFGSVDSLKKEASLPAVLVSSDFLDLMEEMNKGPSLKQYILPNKGELIAVWCEGDGQWYRAVHNDERNEELHVFYIDVGYEEWVEREKVRSIVPKFAHLPQQVIECQLDGVDIIKDKLEASREFFEEIVKDEILFAKLMYKSVSGSLGVKLYLVHNEDTLSINQKMIDSKLALPAVPVGSPPPSSTPTKTKSNLIMIPG